MDAATLAILTEVTKSPAFVASRIHRPDEIVMVKWPRHDRVVWANETCARLMGVPQAELINTPSSEHWGDDFAEYHKDDLEIIASGKPRLSYRERLRRGPEAPGLQTDKFPIEVNGEWYVVAFIRVLSESVRVAREGIDARDFGHCYDPEQLANDIEFLDGLVEQLGGPPA